MERTILLVSAVLGTIFVAFWCFLYFKYKNQFSGLIDDVDSKIFTLKDVYFIGLGLIDIYEMVAGKRILDSDRATEKMKELAIVFGRNNAEMYYYIQSCAMLSLLFTFLPVGLLLGCVMKSALGLFLGGIVVFALVYGVNSGIKASVEREKESIVDEFPRMVSKLTMLVNAGMLVRRAWDEVANSNFEYPLYREMRTTSKDILEGMAIDAAMDAFAQRCGVKEIRKFSSIYVQAIKRGASESIDSMKTMSDEAWEQKKQYAKQKGEIASQKLLIPNMIMFFGILLVVVAPMVITMMGGISF